jgi:hypothetical protein
MLANEFIRLPIHMIDRLPPRHSALGPGTQAGHARMAQAQHPGYRAHAADSLGDARVTLDPTVRDKWGLPVRASPATCTRTHLKSAKCRPSAPKPGSKRPAPSTHQTHGRQAGLGFRRPASGRHLPHGQRSQSLRRQSQLPDSRRRQCLRHRLKRARHQRRLQSGAHHHGHRLYGLCALVRNWKGTGFRS